MDNKTNKILEALQLQPLSEEEKKARHILGRLYGPIATCTESTRNGRKYNKALWEKALADDIFKEKIDHKSLFLELGHPMDREETDMEKVCACIPEIPKIVDGDLYAYVDILDTNNGRLLKTLCDYGFVPGISSRGSGDIMPNDEVDPETFFLETWDIVQLPAVKKARLAICESLESKTEKGEALRKALQESYNNADDKGKEEIKEALSNLSINALNEEAGLFPGGTPKDINKIPVSTLSDAILFEDASDAEEEEADMEDKIEEIAAEEVIEEPAVEEPVEEAPVEDVVVDDAPVEEPVEVPAEEEVIEDTVVEEEPVFTKEEVKEIATEVATAVSAPVEDENEADEQAAEIEEVVDAKVEEAAEEKAEEIEQTSDDGDKDNEVVEEPSDVNIDEVADEEAAEEPVDEEAKSDESEEDESEATDGGIDEVLEGIKDLVRKNGLLESEIKSLRSEKAVGDAKVKELQEELEKYKKAFGRTSELAAKATKVEKANKELAEQLSVKAAEIENLKANVTDRQTLTESIKTSEDKVAKLTEALADAKKENNEIVESYEAKLNESATKAKEFKGVAQRYKARFESVLESYIGVKAKMLGVDRAEIVERLGKVYSVEDVDRVCESLLSVNVNINRLPFSTVRGNVKVRESVEARHPNMPMSVEDGYEIDDSLLELAGLKD